jgi:hypothetical protein
MSNIKENVANLLFKYPQTRDCNYKLYGNYMYTYHPGALSISLESYLHNMVKEEYPKIETITRCSRQLQEKFPHLRGLEWEKRQKQVKPVQENLGYNTK